MNAVLSTYADGRPYRAPRSAFDSTPGPFLSPRAMPTIALTASVGWPGFWNLVQARLREKAFQRGTLRTYRQVLRSFRKHLEETAHAVQPRLSKPADTSRADIKGFITALVDRQVSWSWQSTCVAVLRTTFDKLAGLSVTAGLCTPRRPIKLGDILSSDDVARMIEAAPTIRDRLLLGLLYGCGLKVGELCRLRWQDVDVASSQLTVRFALTRSRCVAVPEALLPVLTLGVRQCPANDHIFRGTRPDKPLSERSVERIVRRLALDAGLLKDVCCMTLRHSYAVTRLRHGANTCQIQENLGHRSIKTTLRYERYILPTDFVSPADRISSQALGLKPVLGSVSEGASDVPVPSVPTPSSFAPPVLLAPESLRADALELPFPEISSHAREFYALLKTCIKDRYLVLRRVIWRAGSSP